MKIEEFTKENNRIPITRLTALWALSESMLGGLLHAAHIPFRGMVMSSVAIIIIILIAHFSNKNGDILRVTILVLVIKAAISPHTPILAYGVVFLQGLLGELFFLTKRFFILSSFALGIVVAILTGLHRIITFTLIFGMTLWDAINQFVIFVVKEFLFSSAELSSFNFSFILVLSYVLIHVFCGLASALFASRLLVKINSEDIKNLVLSEMHSLKLISDEIDTSSKHNHWIRKPVYTVIFTISLVLLILSYVDPNAINLSKNSLFIMLFRAVLIIVIWFFFLSPILLKLIKKLLHRKQNEYALEIKNIINHLPFYKHIVSIIWKVSSKSKGIRRINYFLTALIINILTIQLPEK